MDLRLKNVITTRLGIWVLALVCGLMATGCSMTRVGYAMAPVLANWEIGKFVTLDKPQQALADQHLEALHEWHRSTQLPAYVALLDRVAARLTPLSAQSSPTINAGQALSVTEIAQWRQQFTGHLTPVFRRMAEPLAELTLSLRPEQITEIARALAERNEQYDKKHAIADPDKALEARVDRWRDRLESLTGPLTEKQQAWLVYRVRALPELSGWRQVRLARQHKVMTVLRQAQTERPSREELVDKLLLVFRDFAEPADPETAARRQAMFEQSDQMLADLLSIGTPRQFAHARELFADLAGDLRAIAGLPESYAGVPAPQSRVAGARSL